MKFIFAMLVMVLVFFSLGISGIVKNDNYPVMTRGQPVILQADLQAESQASFNLEPIIEDVQNEVSQATGQAEIALIKASGQPVEVLSVRLPGDLNSESNSNSRSTDYDYEYDNMSREPEFVDLRRNREGEFSQSGFV